MRRGKVVKSGVVLLATVVLLVFAACLPKMTAFWMDEKNLSQVRFETMQSVQLEIQESLSPMGKLALMTNLETNVEVSSGEATMSLEEVQAVTRKALEPYIASGLMQDFEADYSEWQTLWVWNPQDLEQNSIFWGGVMASNVEPFYSLQVVVDDETGKLLMIHFWGDERIEESEQETLLAAFCEIYFQDLQITGYADFVTDDLETRYIGENVCGVRYRFGDVAYGEINVDFFVCKNGFYMEMA